MHLRLEKSLNTVLRATILLLSVVAISSGCNQQRYEPAPWRAAARKTTLPVNNTLIANGSRWSSLPMNRMGTLPFRNAYGSTLPNRGGFGGTLPMRNWTTFPNQGGMSTLPQRGGGRWGQRPIGSTLPDRRGIGRMNTLPQRYPEYRVPRRNWSTLPESSDRFVPLRLQGTTMPLRGNRLRNLKPWPE